MSASDWRQQWEQPLEAVLCPACDRRYLYPAATDPARCPLCLEGALTPLEADAELLPYTRPPEMALPFAISDTRFSEQVRAFAQAIPLAPADLTPENLRRRSQRLYLPRWLVDADVQATFRAETGFDYEVVSHRERYAGERWQTEKVRESRIRWEPRAGRLRRHYDNVAAPALEAEETWQARLGPYTLSEATPYRPEALGAAAVVLPDRSPDDAWPAAIPPLRARAQEETRRAAQADHIRDFRWAPAYGQQNWTQLLQPVLATFYIDDEGIPRPIVMNGQSGKIDGTRRASMARARKLALGFGAVAALFLIVTLLLALFASFRDTVLFAPAGVTLALSFLFLLAAIIPPLIVWRFNRRR